MTDREKSGSGLPASTGPSLGGGPDTTVFVWGIWSVAVVYALLLAYRGRKFPYTDDWVVGPLAIGELSRLEWLLALQGQHLNPFPKLILLAVHNRVVGFDFRAGIFVNVLVLGALAAVMVLMAGRLRGETSYSDAFFPLAYLHGGVGALYWGFHINFVIPTALITIFLMIVLRQGNRMTPVGSLIAGSCVVLLAISTTAGLAAVPALALWLTYSGIRDWKLKTRGASAPALIMLASVVGALSICVVYFVVYKPPLATPMTSPGVSATVRTAAYALASAIWSPPLTLILDNRPSWRFMVSAALLVTGAVVATTMVRTHEDRSRSAGVLLVLGAIISVAVAIGVGRGARVWYYLDFHYDTLALPVFCWIYFAWQIYGSRAAGRLVQMSLLTLACGVFALNVPQSYRLTDSIMSANRAVERDIKAGVEPCELAKRHLDLFWYSENRVEGVNAAAAGLRMLDRVSRYPSRALRDERTGAECP